MRMGAKRRLWLTLLIQLVALAGVIGVGASPAYAHWYQECAAYAHDGTDVKVMTKLNHPDTGAYSNGYIRPQLDGSWCTNAGNNDGDVQDVWLTAYGDNLISGQYDNCARNMKGWKGGIPGWGEWWIANIPTVSLMDPYPRCDWGDKGVRTRAQGKGQYVDGHYLTVWVYNPMHPAI